MATTTVLVGFDGSPPSHAAVRLAVQHAGPEGEVVIAYVSHPAADWATVDASAAGLDDREVQRHREVGERILAQLDPADIAGARVRTRLGDGNPARVLDALAREEDVDEIVVGAGRTGAMRGRVALALVRQADRPVVVVPGPAKGAGPVAA